MNVRNLKFDSSEQRGRAGAKIVEGRRKKCRGPYLGLIWDCGTFDKKKLLDVKMLFLCLDLSIF